MIIASIQAALFVYYVLYVWIRYGVQPSISDSYYIVDKGKKWMFTLILCFAVGLLHCFHSDFSSLFFFAGAGLCFTGAAALFKDNKMTKYVHYIGAVSAILLSNIALWMLGVKWVAAINLTGLVAVSYLNNKIWWFEIIAFITIIIGVFQLYQ